MCLKLTKPIAFIFLTVIFVSGALSKDFRSDIKVTDLKVSSGLSYEVAENLQVGDKEYTDRDYTFTSVPDFLLGLTWIRTANNDKKAATLEVSFKIDKEAYVYILWVARDPAQQDWLQKDYTKIEGEVGSTDEPLAVYKSNKPFSAGEIKTYQSNTGAGHYVIVLEATPPLASVKAWGKLTTMWGKIKN